LEIPYEYLWVVGVVGIAIFGNYAYETYNDDGITFQAIFFAVITLGGVWLFFDSIIYNMELHY
jgi:hypothetical protein